MREVRRKIAVLLAAALMFSLFYVPPVRAAEEEPEKVSKEVEQDVEKEGEEKQPVVYPLDEGNKDEQGLKYTLDEEHHTATVTGQELMDEMDVMIPEQVEKDNVCYDVTKLKDQCFEECGLLASLTVSDTLEEFSFYSIINSSCKKLYLGAGIRSVNVSNWEVPNLRTIEVSDKNSHYASEGGILYDKNKMVIIRCPDKLKVAGVLRFPKTVTKIKSYAFYHSLQEKMDLSGITYIGQEAFWEAAITGADLRSCRQIESYAFYMCPLKYVRFRKNVRIGYEAFNNVNMKVAYLPDGLEGYEQSSFSKANVECLVTGIDLVEGSPDRFVDFGSSLQKVTIQEGVKTVNKLLFDSNNLKKLYIPGSVTSFVKGDAVDHYFWKGTIYAPKGSAGEAYAAENQYTYCEHGESDHVWRNGTYWEYDDQVRLTGDICDICGTSRNLSFLLNGEEEEPKAKEDVIYQLDENNLDFQGISYLLESDTGNAKADMASADTPEKIVLPDAVKKNGQIYYLTEIGDSAFPDTVKSVTISSWISYIDVEAFNECNKMEQFYVEEDNSDYMSANGVLLRRANYFPAYVVKFPAARTGSYTIPEWVLGIGSYAFYKSRLSEVILGDQIEWIDNYAFEGAKITSMTVPDDIQIGQGIFQKCTLLKWLLVGDNLTYKESSSSTWIGNGLVSDCTRLEAIYIAGLSKDTTNLSDICENCINLHYVILPEKMGKLDSLAFRDSDNIKKMYIPPTASFIHFRECETTELTVYGVKGTVAESAAKESGCLFSAIDDCEHRMEERELCVDGERKLMGKECSICGYLSNMYEVPQRVPEKTPEPTFNPTASPTSEPGPTPEATVPPTPSQTVLPIVPSTAPPVAPPTTPPMTSPTASPTALPTAPPTVPPTTPPMALPTASPTVLPTVAPPASTIVPPTAPPMVPPTIPPMTSPTASPTAFPTAPPTVPPMALPTAPPMTPPTTPPMTSPTVSPTVFPTAPPVVPPPATPMAPPTATPTVLSTDPPIVPPATPMASSTAPPATPSTAPPMVSPDHETSVPSETPVVFSPEPVSPTVQMVPAPLNPQTSLQLTLIRQVTGVYLSTKDNKTIQIRWSSVYGGQTYEIYRKAETEKKYRKIAVIQNQVCQYQDKLVKANIKYSYKIRVAGGVDSVAKTFSVNGMIKPVYSVKKGKKQGTRYITIRLKKYAGNRIQIYMKKKGGKYKKIKLKSDRIKKYRGRFKLRYYMKGKTLSFKIRTYRKEGKKKIVSYYSKEKKIRV